MNAFERAWAQRSTLAASPADAGLFLALAPMDGVTDSVYRDVVTSLAPGRPGISLCASEFVRVTRRPVPAHVLLRDCPELGRGGRTAAGVPVFVQLLGGSAEPMAATAVTAAELGAPGIDVNFGCPARTVNNHDGGATILKTPRRIERIVGTMRRLVPDEIPISVKVRLGWDSSDQLADIARAAEAGGGAWLTVHARTRLQLYRPPVDWAALARARSAVQIPVVANGDLNTPADIRRCAEQSGCHAFMIGRGVMGDPLLFQRVRGIESTAVPMGRYAGLLRHYAGRLLAAGAPERAALGRVKQWLRLGAPGRAPIDGLFQRVKVTKTLEEAMACLPA